MLYTLSNGKTIYLTFEEFINLTPEEEQYLVAYGYGEVIQNPFRGSVIKSKKRVKDPDEDEDEDEFKDYDDDEDEDFNEIPDFDEYIPPEFYE